VALGAVAVVAAVAFAAAAVPGGDGGPDLGPGVRVGTPGSVRSSQPVPSHVVPSEEDSDRAGHGDLDDVGDDQATPVTPGSLLVDEEAEDRDSDDSEHHVDTGTDRDHDSHGAEDADDGPGAED
jgi:hypothetical protein